MADDDKTTIVAAGGEGAAAPAGGKKKIILFGGIGAAVVVLVVAVLMFFGGSKSESDSGGGDEEHAEAVEESHDSHGKASSHGSSKGHGGSSAIHAIENIIVNPAGTGGSRFLSVSIGFELASAAQETAFAQKEIAIRDALITILSSKTVAQLTDVKQKEITRYQIKKRVEKLMGAEEITGVYFTDFVLQ